MTENFLSHEKSMKINNNNNKKKDPFIELDFVSAKNNINFQSLANSENTETQPNKRGPVWSGSNHTIPGYFFQKQFPHFRGE